MSGELIGITILGAQLTVTSVALTWGYVRVVQTLDRIDHRIIEDGLKTRTEIAQGRKS